MTGINTEYTDKKSTQMDKIYSLNRNHLMHLITILTRKLQFLLTLNSHLLRWQLNISTDIPEFVQIVCDNFYEDKNENALQDFYVNRYKELIVSESALKVIKKHTLNNCLIEEI